MHANLTIIGVLTLNVAYQTTEGSSRLIIQGGIDSERLENEGRLGSIHDSTKASVHCVAANKFMVNGSEPV